MFYHPSDNKATIIAKYCGFLLIFLLIIGFGILIFYNDLKMPQRQIVIKINLKDKINICLPEDEKIFEKSFFDF